MFNSERIKWSQLQELITNENSSERSEKTGDIAAWRVWSGFRHAWAKVRYGSVRSHCSNHFVGQWIQRLLVLNNDCHHGKLLSYLATVGEYVPQSVSRRKRSPGLLGACRGAVSWWSVCQKNLHTHAEADNKSPDNNRWTEPVADGRAQHPLYRQNPEQLLLRIIQDKYFEIYLYFTAKKLGTSLQKMLKHALDHAKIKKTSKALLFAALLCNSCTGSRNGSTLHARTIYTHVCEQSLLKISRPVYNL